MIDPECSSTVLRWAFGIIRICLVFTSKCSLKQFMVEFRWARDILSCLVLQSMDHTVTEHGSCSNICPMAERQGDKDEHILGLYRVSEYDFHSVTPD